MVGVSKKEDNARMRPMWLMAGKRLTKNSAR